MTLDLSPYLAKIHLPKPDSHKGQNGKVMVIGGSELFHAASQWSLLVVSRMVDMVFYSSVPSNNDLIKEAKEQFHNGIVVPRDQTEEYIQEAEVVLIGPGMERSGDTQKITNHLLSTYPQKKWVVDAGALQMIDPTLLNERCIITPHQKEYAWLIERIKNPNISWEDFSGASEEFKMEDTLGSDKSHPYTILLKGQVDSIIHNLNQQIDSGSSSIIQISGGNAGMTKGGTGDVLAGLVAGLYAFSDDPFATAVVASYVNKHAGDELYTSVGPFFNATDLANQIPKSLKEIFNL